MPIDATKPLDGVAASKADLRANLQAAKTGIEAGVSSNSGTAITINAASFGDRQYLKVLCTAATAIAVTLANDGPVGKSVELVRTAAGNITAQPGSGATLVRSGATLVKPTSAFFSTTEQSMVYEVDSNTGSAAAWRLVARP